MYLQRPRSTAHKLHTLNPDFTDTMTADITTAVAALERGDLVGLPTETVYGLAADARNPAAIAKIYAAKQRPATHPLIVHVAYDADLSQWVSDIPAAAHQLMAAFWPGALTLILPKHPSVPDCVTGGQPTIALRCPDHPIAQAVLQQFQGGQGGLAAPSANRFGRISPTTAQHVYTELGDKVQMVLDGGACMVGIESTILDLTPCLNNAPPRILRLGAITAEMIEAVIGQQPRYIEQHHSTQHHIAQHNATSSHPIDHQSHRTKQARTDTASMAVSGTLAAHYAPSKPLYWLDLHQLKHALVHQQTVALWLIPEDQQRVSQVIKSIGLIESFDINTSSGLCSWWIMPYDPTQLAQQVYDTLRQMGESNADLLMVSPLPTDLNTPAHDSHLSLWHAVADRLGRAIVGSGSSQDRHSP